MERLEVASLYFDWNGTLLADERLWERSRRAAFRYHGVTPPPPHEYFLHLAECQGDIEKTYQSFGVRANLSELNRVYSQTYAQGIEKLTLRRGAIKTIRTLKARGISSSIITMQLEELFLPVYERFPTLHRSITHLRCGVSDKTAAIRDLATLEGISVERCCYVGDTPSDVIAAKRAGAIAIAYANGVLPTTLLASANPDLIIDDLQELLHIITEAS